MGAHHSGNTIDELDWGRKKSLETRQQLWQSAQTLAIAGVTAGKVMLLFCIEKSSTSLLSDPDGVLAAEVECCKGKKRQS